MHQNEGRFKLQKWSNFIHSAECLHLEITAGHLAVVRSQIPDTLPIVMTEMVHVNSKLRGSIAVLAFRVVQVGVVHHDISLDTLHASLKIGTRGGFATFAASFFLISAA